MPRLTSAEIAQALPTLPKWEMVDGKLTRDFTFATFPDAIAFVNRVAALAEQQNHHPDIDIRYTDIRLALISHDSGGITHRDIRLAKLLDSDRADQREDLAKL